MPGFPAPTTLFPGAGGYTSPTCCSLEVRGARWHGLQRQACVPCPVPTHLLLLLLLLPPHHPATQDRTAQAHSGVPVCWRPNVVVPNAAPLPGLTVHECIGDLPLEAAAAGAATAYSRPPHSFFAARMRDGGNGSSTSDSGGQAGHGGSSSGSGSAGAGEPGGSASGGSSSGWQAGGGSSAGAGGPGGSASIGMVWNHETHQLSDAEMARACAVPKGPPAMGEARRGF